MNKKNLTFRPLSITWILLIISVFIFIILTIYGIIISIINNYYSNYIAYFFLFILLIFLIYEIIRLSFSGRICFKNEFIFVPSDWFDVNNRIQYKCIINYKDIKSIKIIASANNSKNERIAFRLSILSIKKYFEITTYDDTVNRICINHYTKKQIIKILNEINLRIKDFNNSTVINIDEVMKDWYSFGHYKDLA